MEQGKVKRPHSISIEERKRIVVTGVEEVVSMAETTAQIITSAGGLLIGGTEMHMTKFNADDGVLTIDGNVNKVQYAAGSGEKKGLLQKLFK